MCASLLKQTHNKQPLAPLRWFNRGLQRLTGAYGALVGRFAARPLRMLVVLLVVGGAAWWVYAHVPSSFLPTEDQGVLMAMIELPEQATVQQTGEAVQAVEQYLLDEQGDAVASVFAAVGFSFGGSGQNSAMMFIRLRDYARRP